METGISSWAEFKSDLGTALRAWGHDPRLPAASAFVGLLYGLWAFAEDHRQLTPVLAVVGFILIGWPGAERMWYLRIFRGKRVTGAEVQRFIGAFWGRFFALGLVAFIPTIPLVLLPMALLEDSLTEQLVIAAVSGLFLDVLGTFVTPALTYSTGRALEAVAIGLRMLKEQWPRDVWYASVPPLAGLIAIQASVSHLHEGVFVALMVSDVLLALWLKGAIACYYLRRVEVPDDGAVAQAGLFPPSFLRRKTM